MGLLTWATYSDPLIFKYVTKLFYFFRCLLHMLCRKWASSILLIKWPILFIGVGLHLDRELWHMGSLCMTDNHFLQMERRRRRSCTECVQEDQ